MILPTAKTPPKKSLNDLVCYLYGPPKVGKSTFCSQIEDALFLPAEVGLGWLEVFQAPQDGSGIKSWTQFREIVQLLCQAKSLPYKAVVIDTVDALYKMASDAFCSKRGIEYPGDLDHGKGWSILNTALITEISKLTKLGIAVWLLGHKGEVDVTTPTGKWKKLVPMLSPAIRVVLLGMCDLVLFADLRETRKGKEIEQSRVLVTAPSPYWEAGGRVKGLPAELPLDYKTFVDAYNRRNDDGV